MFKYPEDSRIHVGKMGSPKDHKEGGAFRVDLISRRVNAIASTGDGWEHVSVSTIHSCPTWDEMCEVKALFWDAEDAVIQYHPPESQYINHHPFCLHMWRRIGGFTKSELPPKYMVGPG